MKGAGKLLNHVIDQMKASGFEPDDLVYDADGQPTGHTVLDVIQYTQGHVTSELEYDITKREGWNDDGTSKQLKYEGRSA